MHSILDEFFRNKRLPPISTEKKKKKTFKFIVSDNLVESETVQKGDQL